MRSRRKTALCLFRGHVIANVAAENFDGSLDRQDREFAQLLHRSVAFFTELHFSQLREGFFRSAGFEGDVASSDTMTATPVFRVGDDGLPRQVAEAIAPSAEQRAVSSADEMMPLLAWQTRVLCVQCGSSGQVRQPMLHVHTGPPTRPNPTFRRQGEFEKPGSWTRPEAPSAIRRFP
jgi:hypothetical protein